MKINQREVGFVNFIKDENFISTVGKKGSFQRDTRLFYKKITPRSYLAFNVFREETKMSCFTADFWLVQARDEKEFLKQKLQANRLIDIRLGFEIERDYNLYLQYSIVEAHNS